MSFSRNAPKQKSGFLWVPVRAKGSLKKDSPKYVPKKPQSQAAAITRAVPVPVADHEGSSASKFSPCPSLQLYRRSTRLFVYAPYFVTQMNPGYFLLFGLLTCAIVLAILTKKNPDLKY